MSWSSTRHQLVAAKLLVLVAGQACHAGRAVPVIDGARGTVVLPIQFVDLRADGAVSDCPAPPRQTASDSTPCRVRVTAFLQPGPPRTGTVVWSTGDTLHIATSAPDSVTLLGGIHVPLSQVQGTDTWIASLRVPGLAFATIGYRLLLPQTIGLPDRWAFRGDHAPPAPPRTDSLRGILRTDTLTIPGAGGNREVITYLPPGWSSTNDRHVVYMGDGFTARALAPIVDALVWRRVLPAVALVGVRAAPYVPTRPDSRFDRAREYVYGFQGDTTPFRAHERFFLGEVLPWVERTYGIPADRSRRLLWGASNGGAFAMAMAVRHPDRFAGAALSSAVVDRLPDIEHRAASPPPRFTLMAGSFEPAVSATMRRIAAELRALGFPVTFRGYVGGHDDLLWETAFPAQICELLERRCD